MFRIFPERLTLSLSLRYESFLKWLDRPITAAPVKICGRNVAKGEEEGRSEENRGKIEESGTKSDQSSYGDGLGME